MEDKTKYEDNSVIPNDHGIIAMGCSSGHKLTPKEQKAIMDFTVPILLAAEREFKEQQEKEFEEYLDQIESRISAADIKGQVWTELKTFDDRNLPTGDIAGIPIEYSEEGCATMISVPVDNRALVDFVLNSFTDVPKLLAQVRELKKYSTLLENELTRINDEKKG